MKRTLIGFLFLAGNLLAGDPISFQHLPAGDSIQVKFTRSGCFQLETYEFVFERAAAMSVSVAQIEMRWNGERKRREEVGRKALGRATLSEAEVVGLDRLFAFYRTKKPGGCTTVDRISATLLSGDTVKATESFTDGTCATYKMKDLTLLPSIAAKLEPGKK